MEGGGVEVRVPIEWGYFVIGVAVGVMLVGAILEIIRGWRSH